MRVVVLGTRGFPNVQGGVERHCEELYPRLAALGVDVIVLTRAPYTRKAVYPYKGVQCVPLACPQNKFLEAIIHTFFGVIKARQLKADIVHIHAIGPSLLVPFARLLGLKVVVTHHGPDYNRKKWNKLAKRVLKCGEKWGVTCAHQVIAVSLSIRDAIRQTFGRSAVAIPNGVEVAARTSSQEILEQFQLQPEKYILAVGRFVPEKGFQDLLESFQRFSASPENRSWRLVIVGDADHDDAFSRELKLKAGCMANVVLTGFQKKEVLQELYTYAGLFVLPSYHEGLPIVLLEALSFGCSCLVSDIPGNREIGLEQDRYFSPGDVALLAECLEEFSFYPNTEEQRQKRIRYIRETYDWDKIAEMTFKVYKRVYPPQSDEKEMSEGVLLTT